MINLEIKNNGNLKLEEPINGFQLLKQLNDDSLKGIIAIKINDKICDLSSLIDKDAKIEFVDKNSQDGLSIIRHSTAHLLAYAVKSLYENVLIAIGPSIENGFYYDFDREKPFSSDDLVAIEKKMQEIVKEDPKFICEEISRDEALKFFRDRGEIYKCELIAGLPKDEKITLYKLGDFVDLCRGPHVPSARYLKNCKLTKVAGAYWKGDSNNKMLQRIYGTAWATKEDL